MDRQTVSMALSRLSLDDAEVGLGGGDDTVLEQLHDVAHAVGATRLGHYVESPEFQGLERRGIGAVGKLSSR